MIFSLGYIINEKYEILDLIGSGGFGEVYKVKAVDTNDILALKCLLPQIVAEQPELVDIFDDEANAAMQVAHTNVVEIYSNEETEYQGNKIKFFTMEYSDSGDLDEFLKRKETYISLENLKDWIKQLLSGLKAINEKLIHRDLKPQNILIFGNTLKISDFGLSRYIEESTRTLTFKGWGTPQYMAPEIWNDLTPTPHVDQYSMGMIFYVMATLKHPFSPMPSSGNIFEFLRDKHLFEIPQHPKVLNNELPRKLNSIIMRMIEKKPESRYSNVDIILDEIEVIEEKDKPDIPVELIEIAELAKESEHKIKVENLKRAEKRARREEESQNIKKIFNFHCEELLSSFDKVIDTINTQMEPTKIEKSKSSKQPFYSVKYSFQSRGIKIYIEQVYGVNEIEDVIGWGYCTVLEYQDGFNLLLQKIKNGTYGKWRAFFVQDNPLYDYAKHTKPHAVQSLDELNDALRGLHAFHIYQVELREFNESMFIDLVKKLVSQ